ncbi:hypothetical protein JCM9957A_57910 [Kineosporia succinea]
MLTAGTSDPAYTPPPITCTKGDGALLAGQEVRCGDLVVPWTAIYRLGRSSEGVEKQFHRQQRALDRKAAESVAASGPTPPARPAGTPESASRPVAFSSDARFEPATDAHPRCGQVRAGRS